MFKLNESDREYRFGDSGPKYLMRGPRANFGIVVLKPGQDFNNHYHNLMEENFFILEGEIEFTIDGKKVLCRKGDFIHVEPKEAHYLNNISDSIAKAAFCLAPYQEKDKVEAPLD
ncbi:cupin domain-containing protein [Wukongibacter sp. M2B1]|uniref:cupin domain-containing protein n=1 Tax=Wukongibacter sp. M2B1 TaxID=3088895 RepID=UPI003D7AE45C